MKALKRIDLNKMIIIDVETVSVEPELNMLPKEMQDAWESKEGWNRTEDTTPEQHFLDRAALIPEFGKIVCISVGKFMQDRSTHIKSYADTDESSLLEPFIEWLSDKRVSASGVVFVGHNIKNFDAPYICRRTLINGLPIPDKLDNGGKKPWEVDLVDTLELWRFGAKNSASLALLAHLFGLPNPKLDMDGSKVRKVFWQENDLSKIVEYCEQDVRTLGQLILRFKGLPPN